MAPPGLVKVRVVEEAGQKRYQPLCNGNNFLIPLWPEADDVGASEAHVVKVGRAKGSNLQLQCEHLPGLVSRKHAVFRARRSTSSFAESSGSGGGGGPHTFAVEIEDLGGLNGTYVNGLRLTERRPVRLRDKDIISFGGDETILFSGRKENDSAQPHQKETTRNEFIYRFEDNFSNCEKSLKDSSSSKMEQEVGGDRTGSGESMNKRPKLVGESHGVPCCSSYKLKDSVLEQVEENFECFICRDWVVGTTAMAPCGHLGCAECIEQWLKRNKTCPVCRQKCSSLVPVKTVDSFLEKMLVPLLDQEEMKVFKERVHRLNERKKKPSTSSSSKGKRKENARPLANRASNHNAGRQQRRETVDLTGEGTLYNVVPMPDEIPEIPEGYTFIPNFRRIGR